MCTKETIFVTLKYNGDKLPKKYAQIKNLVKFCH